MKNKIKCLSQKYQSALPFVFVHSGNHSNYYGIFKRN